MFRSKHSLSRSMDKSKTPPPPPEPEQQETENNNRDTSTTTTTTTTTDNNSNLDSISEDNQTDNTEGSINKEQQEEENKKDQVEQEQHKDGEPAQEQGQENEEDKEVTFEAGAEGGEEIVDNTDSNLEKLAEDIDQFLSSFPINSDPSAADAPPPQPLEVPSCVKTFAKIVELLISKYDTGDSPTKLYQDSDADFVIFFNSVGRISKLTTNLAQLQLSSDSADCISLVNLTSKILYRSMSLLEDEFKTLLEDSRSSFDPDPNDLKTNTNTKSLNDHDRFASQQSDTPAGSCEDDNFPGYSPETVANLKRIANTMISSGYETECCQIFSICRRNAFDERLSKLGFEKISIDDVQKMQWESLEGEIATWIRVAKRCISIYFSEELKLCDEVFADHSMISTSLFSNLTRNVVIQLIIFAEAVCMTKRSPEKLFKFLDMYETLRDLIPKLDELFPEESTQDLKSETSSVQCRLGEAAVGIFCDLENSIKSDMGKTPVPGGAVHPLTRYTMNYVKYACEYKETLEQVFQEHHKKLDRSDSTVSDTDVTTPTSHNQHNHHHHTPKPSPFSKQLMAVMDLLDSNLEAKSKLYKDISLSYIFLMNNGRYIMQKIKGSTEIHDLMGDTWCRRRSSDLRQYHKNYQRETWSKVLACLKDEGLQVNGKVQKPVLKERFKSFNAMFDEIHKTQSSWVVSDEQLQSELRVSISAVVIPAYRSFLGRFRQYLDPGRQTEKYIKFGPEDVETYIDELFDGNPASMVRRRT